MPPITSPAPASASTSASACASPVDEHLTSLLPTLNLGSSPEACLTDVDISRRTLAASGLNVSAPEFVPTFATSISSTSNTETTTATTPPQPTTPPPPPPPHPLSPPDAYAPPPHLPMPDVYSNVTDLLPLTPLLSTPLPAPPSPPRPDTDSQHILHQFDAQFPALSSISTDPSAHLSPHHALNHAPDVAKLPQALAWSRLQHEQEHKERATAAARRIHAFHASLFPPSLEHSPLQHAHIHDRDQHLDLHDLNVVEDLMPPLALSHDVGSWVQTGSSVGTLYDALRAEAAQQASVRNKFYDRAAAAFKKGDGANAKKFSALGKEANERMKELHRKAADAIFEARNPPGVDDVLDLHGLHVSEAVERLPVALESTSAERVRILTGTGHHTKGTGRARLRPAVEKWLQENGYFFEEVVDANDYVGSFIVDIKR